MLVLLAGKVTVVFFHNPICKNIWNQNLPLFHNQNRYPGPLLSFLMSFGDQGYPLRDYLMLPMVQKMQHFVVKLQCITVGIVEQDGRQNVYLVSLFQNGDA
jgi:hypothetical protein